MAQPSFIDLFGVGATYNPATDKLEITKAALESAGITLASNATPIECLGAITKKAHDWLVANTDESVLATSTLNASSPSFRFGKDKTLFIFTIEFYGDYKTPYFDPNQV